MIAEVPSGDVEIVNTTKIERIDELTEDIEQGKADVEKHDQEFEKTQGGAGDENNKDNENDEDGSSSWSCNVARMSWKGKVVFMVALGSMIMNGVAMAVKATIMVFVAGFIALFIAPVVMGLQLKLENTECTFFFAARRRLSDIATRLTHSVCASPVFCGCPSGRCLDSFFEILSAFDDVHNKLRKDVNTLGEENDKLTAENDALEEQLGKLQEEEKRLKDITESQGVNVDEFVALVKENRLLLDKQEVCITCYLMTFLREIVLSATSLITTWIPDSSLALSPNHWFFGSLRPSISPHLIHQ